LMIIFVTILFKRLYWTVALIASLQSKS